MCALGPVGRSLIARTPAGDGGAFVTTLLLAGRSQVEAWRHPEVAVCAQHTSSRLNAPSTYKRAKVYIPDRKFSFRYWSEGTKELMGANASLPDLTEMDQERAAEGGVRSVVIRYDAANGFGVLTRGVSSCTFEMDSFSDDTFVKEPSSSSAELEVAMIEASEGETANPARCCESERTMARVRAYEPQAQFLSQQVLE